MPRRPGPGQRRPTIADIAEKAGVSKGSVSYALNGNPGLSDRTRRRILAIAEEVGWRPNRAAQALSASRSGACGLVIARPARTLAYEPFFSRLLSGIEAQLSECHVALMVQIVEDVDAEVEALRRWWAERRVDGALLVDLRVEDPRTQAVEDMGMPAVIVGGPGHTGNLPFFPGNDGGGIRQIVTHLASLGHRQIDRVAGSPAFASTQVRTRAFKHALARAGARGRIINTDYTSTAGADATEKLLSKDPPPSAIVYDSDIMAVAGLNAAQEMGLSVPDQLSLASFDDSILCEVVRPALTACARDVVAYGATVAGALVSVIEGDDVPLHGEQSSVLVARASTGGAP